MDTDKPFIERLQILYRLLAGPVDLDVLCEWAVLDGYYVPTRYPNSLPESISAHAYTQGAARESVAKEVVRFVRDRLFGGERRAKGGSA